ncbi:helix-hairpin-helix domain-containing protein [Paucisalibacillus globulus]|uniref:helix-hairpin-helix domain-containing protein n=1 Tax=Paucisalibacillus globulus TaxID=351095 RepID=UPI000BB6FA5B|nr:helix-hairpin-helix domain-containing protein [Paucisalibacillus globulus]
MMNQEEVPPQEIVQVSSESSSEDLSSKELEQGQLIVDVKGEVKQPGVYEMAADTRVKDVIKRAGGFTGEADQYEINLAQKLFDEMILIVPKLGEENTSNTVIKSSKVRINYATVEEIQKLPGIGPSKAKAIVEYRDEIGYFQSAQDLLNVSGIGEKTLESLLEEIQIP